jgi:hypothetical protein
VVQLFGVVQEGKRVNKVLVTGLALGKSFDTCDVCNFDMDWLLRYPSVLVWADKILIPEGIWQVASTGNFPFPDKYPELSKCVQLIFNVAKSKDIIEIVKPETVIDQSLNDSIAEQVEKDRVQLSKLFPDNIKLGIDVEKDKEGYVPGQIFIDGVEYCFPSMWTVYASLTLARTWDADCLFGDTSLNLCKYKFGLSSFSQNVGTGSIESFQSIFDAYLPNESIFPEYLVTSKDLCAMCKHESACKDTYLLTLETNLENLLSWRDYDEMIQLRSIIDEIVDRRIKVGGIIDPNDIRQDFQDKQNKLRQRIQLVFPKVRRWVNITTILSIPVVLAGIATSSPLFTIAGGSLAGLSQATKQVVEFLSNKYSWIGFTSKDTKLSSK